MDIVISSQIHRAFFECKLGGEQRLRYIWLHITVDLRGRETVKFPVRDAERSHAGCPKTNFSRPVFSDWKCRDGPAARMHFCAVGLAGARAVLIPDRIFTRSEGQANRRKAVGRALGGLPSWQGQCFGGARFVSASWRPPQRRHNSSR